MKMEATYHSDIPALAQTTQKAAIFTITLHVLTKKNGGNAFEFICSSSLNFNALTGRSAPAYGRSFFRQFVAVLIC
jgi:hypothetical protein